MKDLIIGLLLGVWVGFIMLVILALKFRQD